MNELYETNSAAILTEQDINPRKKSWLTTTASMLASDLKWINVTSSKGLLATVFLALALVVAGVTLPVWLPMVLIGGLGFFEVGNFFINLKNWVNDWAKLNKEQNKHWKRLGILAQILLLVTATAPLFAALGCLTFVGLGLMTALGLFSSGALPAIVGTILGVAVPTLFAGAFALSTLSLLIKLPGILREDGYKDAKGFWGKAAYIAKRLPGEITALAICGFSFAAVSIALLSPAILAAAGVAVPVVLTTTAVVVLAGAAVAWAAKTVHAIMKPILSSALSFLDKKVFTNPNTRAYKIFHWVASCFGINPSQPNINNGYQPMFDDWEIENADEENIEDNQENIEDNQENIEDNHIISAENTTKIQKNQTNTENFGPNNNIANNPENFYNKNNKETYDGSNGASHNYNPPKPGTSLIDNNQNA